MASQSYVDPALFTEAKEADFRQRRLDGIARRLNESATLSPQVEADKQGGRFRQSGTEGGDREETPGDAIERAAKRLQELSGQLSASRIELSDYIEEYRSLTHPDHWIQLLVAPSEGNTVATLSGLISRHGLPLMPNRLQLDSPPQDQFDLFGLLHVSAPPDPTLLQALAAQDGVGAVFDAETAVGVRPPEVEPPGIGPELHQSREMIWPTGASVPKDLPPPGIGVTIAVIDSGIDDSHPDLVGKVISRRDFTPEDDGLDRCGHGTHCAGIIAGSGAASGGSIAGIAPNVTLISAKVLDGNGSGRLSDLLLGLKWAHDQGADVISMSLGAPGSTDGQSIVSRACTALVERGIIVCVSAGNDGPGPATITIPADARGAVAVGAVDKSGRVAGFSSRGPTDDPEATGPKPDVVAPGVTITSCRSRHSPGVAGDYVAFSGTSMANPHVSGAIGVLLSFAKKVGIELAPEALIGLMKGAVTAPSEGHSPASGKGLINIPAALAAMDQMRPNRTQPQPEQLSPLAGASSFQPIQRTPEMAAASKARSEPAAERFTSVNCGSCHRRLVTRLHIAANCPHANCEKPICHNCWREGQVPFCEEHRVRTSSDIIAPAVNVEWSDLRSHAAPDGTVTLLFTDIEDSTGMTERLGDRRMQEVLRVHNGIIRQQVADCGGFEVKSLGDGFMLAFSGARRALECSMAIQRAFAAHNLEHPDQVVRVRIGIHTGEFVQEMEDFFGKNVILASRIAGQAQGGQILVSSLLKELTESAGDIKFGQMQEVELKGLTGLNRVYSVDWK